MKSTWAVVQEQEKTLVARKNTVLDPGREQVLGIDVKVSRSGDVLAFYISVRSLGFIRHAIKRGSLVLEVCRQPFSTIQERTLVVKCNLLDRKSLHNLSPCVRIPFPVSGPICSVCRCQVGKVIGQLVNLAVLCSH